MITPETESPNRAPDVGKNSPRTSPNLPIQVFVFIALVLVLWYFLYQRLFPSPGIIALVEAYDQPVWSSAVLSLFLVSSITLAFRAGILMDLGVIKTSGAERDWVNRLPPYLLLGCFFLSLGGLFLLKKNCQPPSFNFQVTTDRMYQVAPQMTLEIGPSVTMATVEVLSSLPPEEMQCSLMIAGDSVIGTNTKINRCQVNVAFNDNPGFAVLVAEVHKRNCSNGAMYSLFFQKK
jgi:hypothetical protein